MTNVSKKLSVLESRYEKVVELNQKHNYTSMIIVNGRLSDNPKSEQYFRMLSKIKCEKARLWAENREQNKKYSENVKKGINALVSLTKEDLFNLTAPAL